jgi:hypothetical protein
MYLPPCSLRSCHSLPTWRYHQKNTYHYVDKIPSITEKDLADTDLNLFHQTKQKNTMKTLIQSQSGLLVRKPFLTSTLIFVLSLCFLFSAHAQCTGDCQNGKGKNVDKDGNSFEGNWINGKLNGPGVMALPNGIKYVGEFKDDAMHGYGVVYLANGNVAQAGIFENNKLNTTLSESAVNDALQKNKNESTSTASNGCTGDCQNGKGKKVDADGNTFEGTWKNGELDGKGVMAMPNGVKYVGEFKNGAMHGYGAVYTASGTVAQSGVFENNALKTSKPESEVKMYLMKYN